MKLEDAYIGQIVKYTAGSNRGIGHIRGLTNNCSGETIFKVKWANGEKTDMHPANVEPINKYR